MSICIFCGKEGAEDNLGPDFYSGIVTIYHYNCVYCPQCKQDEGFLWKRRHFPFIIKCLNCGFTSFYLKGAWV